MEILRHLLFQDLVSIELLLKILWVNTDTILINQPEKLRIELYPTDVSCFNGSDGQIISNVIGVHIS